MVARAIARYVRISAGKVSKYSRAIKNMPYKEAKAVLHLTPAKGATVLYRVIQSAVSNLMVNNKNIDEDGIQIEDVGISEGPTLKRLVPRARGRADRKRKRTCHISVMVSGREVKK